MNKKEIIFYIYAIAGWLIIIIILTLTSLLYIEGYGYIYLVVIDLPMLIIESILSYLVLIFMIIFIIKRRNKD